MLVLLVPDDDHLTHLLPPPLLEKVGDLSQHCSMSFSKSALRGGVQSGLNASPVHFDRVEREALYAAETLACFCVSAGNAKIPRALPDKTEITKGS